MNTISRRTAPRIVLLAGAFALLPLAAFSAPPGGGGGSGSGNTGVPENRRLQRDVSGDQPIAQRGQPPGVVLSGRVVDSSGSPLRGIVLKLFSNGALTESATSDGDGSFSIAANPMTEGNNTTVLWFESPDPETLLDVPVLVHGGTVSQENNLFSSCMETVRMIGGSATLQVTMLTSDERRTATLEANCLD